MGSTHRHGWMFLLPWLICLAAGIFSSCTPLGRQKEDEKGLLLAVERFSKDIRWGDYKSASSWIAPEAKEQFWDQTERLREGVRIIDYQVVDVLLDGDSGKVTLRYRFYQKQNPRIQTITLHQQWLFSGQDGVWQILRNDLQRLMPNFNFE